MQANKIISFTSSWKNTIFITLILSVFISIILIFLQPFDTYTYNAPYKNLKLAGYSLCVIIPLLSIHAIEKIWYKKHGQKWTLLNELLVLTFGFFFINLLCYLYNCYVMNSVQPTLAGLFYWNIYYGLPFACIFITFWAYLRFRFGQILMSEEKIENKLISIEGANANEQIQFEWDEFVMAKSQSNYIDIFLYTKNGEQQKFTLRSTLSKLFDQLPMATQVHRSFLINTVFISELKGNTRKGAAVLNHVEMEVPVSPKYFSALKKELQFHP
ncbi:LytTR family DNA-binding domain-containing protein [Flammeovirga aprica]|uniref:LytTR family transcriptional regulator n=1 Tax=Flammeovirga aprica JL-4 TaxID=694437 RepID=A0A7X9P0J3_9BACT|nr:LytTR family DNA-binding domain-containing protein [Flammeovirga aprica]NME67298.1 LytTR family transcriptional regulator [Flammeovirga aprica JL-4]